MRVLETGLAGRALVQFRLRFPANGSEIIFRTMENPERLRGPNLAWFALDELTYTHEAAWTRLLDRLRHPHARRLCGCAVWTPKGYDLEARLGWQYGWRIG
jgi:hypothetical protein